MATLCSLHIAYAVYDFSAMLLKYAKTWLHDLILEFVFLWQMNLLMHLGQTNGHVHAYWTGGTKTLFSHQTALHPVIALQVHFLSFNEKIDLQALNLPMFALIFPFT